MRKTLFIVSVCVLLSCFTRSAYAQCQPPYFTKLVPGTPASNTLVAAWNCTGCDAFEFVISTSTATPTAGTKTPNISVLVTGLKAGGTYNFCVRAKCDTTNSAWTCARITLPDPESVTTTSVTKSFSIYPNPANDILNIDCGKTGGNFIISNIIGKVVLTEQNENTKFRIDISRLSPGVYFIKYSKDDINQTVKFVKQ